MSEDLIYRIVERAEGYPYDLREDAFLFQGGETRPHEPARLEGRTPVLAIGSNGAPARLATKFGPDAVVPVVPAQLHDFAIVYAAAVTSYGSVPATLVEAPGAAALVALTYLDAAQLEVMHRTEHVGRNYELVTLDGRITTDDAAVTGPVLAYRSLYGPLRVNGQPLRLAEIPTVGTPFGAAYQSGVLALLHHRFADAGEIYAAFIGDLVASQARRELVMTAMAEGLDTARPRPPAASLSALQARPSA
jgi:hypothetical protein